MKKDDLLLTGFDIRKESQILRRSYSDQKGLSSTFYSNVLYLLNQLAGATINPDDYRYMVKYDHERSRVEIHLTAKYDMNLHLRKAGLILGICRGESIRTAMARKFDRNDIGRIASNHDLKIKQLGTDRDQWYSVAVMTL